MLSGKIHQTLVLCYLIYQIKRNYKIFLYSGEFFSFPMVPSAFACIFEVLSSVQLLSRVQLFATPWITAHQASLSITNSRSSLRLTSIESVMPSSHLILCLPTIIFMNPKDRRNGVVSLRTVGVCKEGWEPPIVFKHRKGGGCTSFIQLFYHHTWHAEGTQEISGELMITWEVKMNTWACCC